MHPHKKISYLIHLFLLVILVINTILPAISLAQEVTPDAPPVEITPETTPPAPPTEIIPTETPVFVPPPPPTAGSLFTTDFSDGDISAFLIVGDWSVIGGTAVFSTTIPSANAIINGMLWDDFILVTTVSIAPNGEAIIGLRAGMESYAVRLSDSGNATLWRGDMMLGGTIAPLVEATPDPLANLRSFAVAISAIDGVITIAVDNITQINITDPTPLVAGYVSFGTSATSAGLVGYDNILVQAQVPVISETPVTPIVGGETPIVIPPLNPTPETPIVETTEVVVEVTEPIAEQTLVVELTEPVIETTPNAEITPDAETTPNAEITPDAETAPNAEITPDAETTPEAEITATPVPLDLYEVDIRKLDGVIYGLISTYYDEGEINARAYAEENYIQWGEDGRLRVWIYPASANNIPTLAASLLSMGGEVLYLSDAYIDAILDLDTLIDVTRMGMVFAITLPVPAVPTSANSVQMNGIGTPQRMAMTGSGTIIPHTLDQLGISSWHQADILGDGVNIAVIDIGFAIGTSDVNEQTCLGSAEAINGLGTETHGRNVVEVLCDVAPNAKVWMYTANDASTLATAIHTARIGVPSENFPPAQVILITLNPGSTNTDLQNAVATAYNNNVPVIAAAGNGGDNNTLNFDITVDTPPTLLTITARAGDVITVSSTINGNNTAITQIGGGYSSNNIGTATHAYTIGAQCGAGCQLELTITRNNINTYTVTSSWANAIIEADSTVTLLDDADELIAYTTDYHVFAVGSVCGTQAGRFPLMPYSPQGATGQENTARVKPDIVAPAHINTSLFNTTTISNEYVCSGGFSGSSASAAHVAGMVALLISNPSMSDIYNANLEISRPWQVYSYLKARALDVNNDGFDRNYGAGVATLGNPYFNLSAEITPSEQPNGILAGEHVIYVSSDQLAEYNLLTQANALNYPNEDSNFTTPEGTFDNPFIHITDALEVATQYRTNNPNTRINIVLFPGEYTTPFTIPISNIAILSYDSADSGTHPPSQIWVSDNVNGGALVVTDKTNISLYGLDFIGATPDYDYHATPTMAINPITSLTATNITNFEIVNVSFTSFDSPVQISGGTNIHISDSTFTNFRIDEDESSYAVALLLQNITDTVELNRNVFDYHRYSPITPTNHLSAVVYLKNTRANFMGNQFVGNSTPSILTVDMWNNDYTVRTTNAPITMVNNVLHNNSTSGPIIHLFQGNDFRFVNNTVANNFLTNANWFTIIGLGGNTDDATTVTTHNGDHRWNIANNVFFANRDLSGNIANLALVSEKAGLNLSFACTTSDNSTSGVRYNWFASGTIGYVGDCADSIWNGTQAVNGNQITNVDTDEPSDNILTLGNFKTPGEILRFQADYFVSSGGYAYQLFAGENITHPAIDPFAQDTPSPLDEVLLPFIGDNPNPFENPVALDMMLNPRFRKQNDIQGTSAYSHVDMGAYEYNDQLPIEFFDPGPQTGHSLFDNGSFTVTIAEDATATIDLDTYVRYGFTPYEFEIIPHENIANGLHRGGASCTHSQTPGYRYDPVSHVLTYCPPADFHNSNLHMPQAQIRFQYRVNSPGGSLPSPTTYATITIQITPVNDGGVSTQTVPSQYYIEYGDDALVIPLTPSYTLAPFSLPNQSGNNNRDYPFTYSNFTLNTNVANYEPRLANLINFTEAIQTGIFTYEPHLPLNGTVEFSYRATDNDGQFATRIVRIYVGEILSVGKYDDTDLAFDYRGDWQPQYDQNAYQRTKHVATGTDETYVGFNFRGDAFFIKGTGIITVDPAGTGEMKSLGEYPQLRCRPVDGGTYCDGFNSINPNSVRVVRISNTSTAHLDFVEIFNTPQYPAGRLGVGVYEDVNNGLNPNAVGAFDVYLTNATLTADTRSANDSWALFDNTVTSELAFWINPSANVKRLHIYRPMDTLRDNLTVYPSGGASCNTTPITVSGLGADVMWEVPQSINVTGCDFVRIARIAVSGKTAKAGIDRIALVTGDFSPLGIGTYSTQILFEYANGRTGWIGDYLRLFESTVTFDVTEAVETMILYRETYYLRPAISVTTSSCSITHDQKTTTLPVGTRTTEDVNLEPFVIAVKSCTRITISAPMYNEWSGIIGNMSLNGIYDTSTPLPIGEYDNTELTNHFSNTTYEAQVLAKSGSWNRFGATQSQLRFTVASDVERVLVYRPMSDTRDNLIAELSGSYCTTATQVLDSYVSIDFVWGQSYLIILGDCDTVTITKANIKTGDIGIEHISLIGTETSLGIGTYHTKNLLPYFTGRNANLSHSIAPNGIGHRLLDGELVFNVEASVKGLIVYRHDWIDRDDIRVTRKTCSNSQDENTSIDIVNTYPTANSTTYQPVYINLLSCSRVSIIRSEFVNNQPSLGNLVLVGASPNVLQAGEYDNLDIIDKFTNGLLVGQLLASSGSWHQLNTAQDYLQFTVASDVERMLVFRPMSDIRHNLKIDFLGANCTPSSTIISSFVGNDPVWNQSHLVAIGACKTIKISRINTDGRTDVIGVDRIILLRNPNPLVLGLNENGTARTYTVNTHPALLEYFTIRNAALPHALAPNGLAHRLLDGEFTFTVAENVGSVKLYRHNWTQRDNLFIEVMCDNTVNYSFTATNTDTNGTAYEPIYISTTICKKVRITRPIVVNNQPAFGELVLLPKSADVLPKGTYDNLDIVDKFMGGKVENTTQASGGSWHRFDATSDYLQFTVADNVGRVLVYRPMSNVRHDLNVELSNGCTRSPFQLSSFVGNDFVWTQSHIIDLNGCKTVKISRGTARTDPIGIERIDLLEGTTPPVLDLVSGEGDSNIYHPEDLHAYFSHRNATLPDSLAPRGRGHRLIDGEFKFSVTPDVKFVLLYRHNWTQRDTLKITRASCSTSSDATPFDVTNTNTTGSSYEPIVINMLSCTQVVVTRNIVNNQPSLGHLVLLPESPTVLGLGTYDNLDILNKFSSATSPNVYTNPMAYRGTWHHLNSTTDKLTFDVTSDVKRILIYRQIDSNRDNLVVEMSQNCTNHTFTVSNSVGDTTPLWGANPGDGGQPHVVDLKGCTRVVIRAEGVAGKTNTGVDRIDLLGEAQSLGVGTHHSKDLKQFFMGPSADLYDARAQEGVGVRILGGDFRIPVTNDVSRVVIYRYNTTVRSPLTITGEGCTIIHNPDISTNAVASFTVTSTGTDADWGHPIVVGWSGSCTAIKISRQNMGMPAPAVERIVLLPVPTPTLNAGNVYQEYHPGLTFSSGNWQDALNGHSVSVQLIPSHRMVYTGTDNANVTFTTNGNGVILWHRAFTGTSNAVEVCVSTPIGSTTETVCTNYSTTSPTEIGSYPVAILGLGVGNHTVTVTNRHSGGNLFFDRVEILPDYTAPEPQS